jgi:catechol 2,3-dioxygenase-like lactoylglutathione lyase family enzyme
MVQADFNYVGIRVKDLQESIEFYSKVLGMRLTGKTRIEKTKSEVGSLESKDAVFS